MWGGKADAMCGQHHWPVWGHERIDTMIRQQRDLYKFAHDQTIRLMNHGLTAAEIAEAIQPAGEPRRRLARPRLLRPHPAQCEGDLPEISRLVRRQSGQSRSAAAGRVRQEICRVYGRRRRDPGAGAPRISPRASSASSRRPSAIWCSPIPTIRPRARCWRIPSSSSATPSESSTWRNAYLFGAQEVAAGHAEGAAALADAARDAGGAAHRAAMGRARRPPQRPQGRRQAHRAELEFHRHRRDASSSIWRIAR